MVEISTPRINYIINTLLFLRKLIKLCFIAAFKSCLWWTWLTLMASSSLAEIDCCSKDVIWESGKNCSDGSKISLVCPNKMYLIDQSDPSDQFNVVNENGSWLVLASESDEIRIPQNE